MKKSTLKELKMIKERSLFSKIGNSKIIYRKSKRKRNLIGSSKEKSFTHNQYTY